MDGKIRTKCKQTFLHVKAHKEKKAFAAAKTKPTF